MILSIIPSLRNLRTGLGLAELFFFDMTNTIQIALDCKCPARQATVAPCGINVSSTYWMLLADDLYQNSFLPPSVEFTIEDLLLRPEVQHASAHTGNNLTPHELPLDVGIGVLLTS